LESVSRELEIARFRDGRVAEVRKWSGELDGFFAQGESVEDEIDVLGASCPLHGEFSYMSCLAV